MHYFVYGPQFLKIEHNVFWYFNVLEQLAIIIFDEFSDICNWDIMGIDDLDVCHKSLSLSLYIYIYI